MRNVRWIASICILLSSPLTYSEDWVPWDANLIVNDVGFFAPSPENRTCASCVPDLPQNLISYSEISQRDVALAEIYGERGADWATHEVSMTAVILNKSGWGTEEILERWKHAAKIYRACKLRIRPFKVVVMNTPAKKEKQSSVHVRRDFRRYDLMKKIAQYPQPAVVYTKEALTNLLGLNVDFSHANWSEGETVGWVSRAVVGDGYLDTLKRAAPDYLPDPHEVMHILLQAGHTRMRGHLMGWNPGAGLTEADCARLRQSPLVRSLPQ